jgi:hypothetical protein
VELIGHPTPCHSERGSPTTESKNLPKVRSALLVSATRTRKERPNPPLAPPPRQLLSLVDPARHGVGRRILL